MAGKSSEDVEQNSDSGEQSCTVQVLDEQAGAAVDIDQECLIKHPLQHTWTLWYLEMDRSKTWAESMNQVASFSTVEDFWSLHNHIRGPSEIKMGTDYMLFKSHIRPMWEDETNNRGGRWTLSINKQLSDKYWMDTALCLIGEAFESSEDICGAIVNVRQKVDKISIWTANCQNREAVIDIGKTFKERLGLRSQIFYHTHKDTMIKSSSSTKAIYSV